jgi:hypothetical protein
VPAPCATARSRTIYSAHLEHFFWELVWDTYPATNEHLRSPAGTDNARYASENVMINLGMIARPKGTPIQ